MPTISVIVPIYKVENYLSNCINSILSQTFEDFELILVDDGSPDNCGKICDEYKNKDDRIIVIHKENGGLSDARNKGIDIAKGSFLTFIDSDDLITKDYLKFLYELAITNSADISICSLEEFSDDSDYSISETGIMKNNVQLYTGKDACKHIYLMDGKISVCACGKLYSACIFQSLRFPFGKINEDVGTIPIALYNAATVVSTDMKLYKYRFRDDSIMHKNFTSKRFDGLFCTQICIDFFKKNNDIEMIKLAEIDKSVLQAMLIIEAKSAKAVAEIPAEYYMPERKALKILRTYLSDKKYCWYLAKIHPKWLLGHAYLRKIKKTIGIKCN